MADPRDNEIVLQCHPDTPCAAVESIEASIRWDKSRTLTIKYVVAGAVDQLRIPLEQSARETDELWQHTCFELFIGAQNDAEYYEFNFSPSGEWSVYEFRKYRDGGPIHIDGLDPKIAVQRSTDALELSAKVRLNRLPGTHPDVYLSLGLATVIEDRDGSLSYWALKHPPGNPDFHHADNFTLQIEPAVVDGAAIDDRAKP
jgi:hypothetical protein